MREPQSCKITNCIANVSGLCAAEKCYGPLTRLKDPRRSESSFESAAKIYQLIMADFDSFFGDNYIDEDTNE